MQLGWQWKTSIIIDGEIQIEGTTLESFHLWEICAEQLGATSIDIDIYAEIKVEELTLKL